MNINVASTSNFGAEESKNVKGNSDLDLSAEQRPQTAPVQSSAAIADDWPASNKDEMIS